jgi:hypothetical protein
MPALAPKFPQAAADAGLSQPPPQELAQRELAHWRGQLRFDAPGPRYSYQPGAERSYVRLPSPAGCEAWLICWPPGSRAPWHDHGSAAALATVLCGELRERVQASAAVRGSRTRSWRAGSVIEIAPYACHEVWNASVHTAYSVHVYTPRLDDMTFYTRTRTGELRVLHKEQAAQW